MLSILSWNIRQGGGSRSRDILKAIQEDGSEIIILSEYRNNDKGASIRDGLLRLGYRYQGVTARPAQDNAVIVASKMPGDIILHPESDKTYAGNIIEMQFSAFNVIGCYLPHKKKHLLLSYIIDLISATQKPYIIAGDYNTGINKVDQEGTSFWYQPEMRKLEEVGYIDAFRSVYGDKRDYSWYSHQGNGYRYDHTYIDKDLKGLIKDCDYIHAWREQKLSDHSPMKLVLG